MEETSRHSDQEQDLIYALDIGTRSVIGLLARQEQDKMRVLEVERRPHERRTMLDGQIEDIRQVAKVVSEVTKSLEERRALTRPYIFTYTYRDTWTQDDMADGVRTLYNIRLLPPLIRSQYYLASLPHFTSGV